MNVFDNFSDMRIFDNVEFPGFIKYYIEDENIINKVSNYLLWSHISPSGKKIEWFTKRNYELFNLFNMIQDKSQNITAGNTYKYLDELDDKNLTKEDRFFKFYKDNVIYKARLALVYYYNPDMLYLVFNIESIEK